MKKEKGRGGGEEGIRKVSKLSQKMNTVTYDFPCKLSDTSTVPESDASFLSKRELERVKTTALRTAHYPLPVISTTYPRTVVAIISYYNTLLLC